MLLRARSLVVAGGCLLGMTVVSFAAEEAVPAVAEVPGQASDVAAALEGLGSANFNVRRDATRKLLAAGAEAVGPVAKAANSDDLETSVRSFNVLKLLYIGGDPATRSAAEKALQKLSDTGGKSIAQRAAEAIRKPEPVDPRGNVFGGVVQVQMGPAIAQRVRPAMAPVPANNGNVLSREIVVSEGAKKIRIREEAAEIQVEITETENGKPKTTLHKAANLFDLRKNNAEAAALFVKYFRGAAGRAPAAPVAQTAPVALNIRQNFRMSVKNVNGQREISIDDNGRKIEISDNSGKDIVVKLTEPVDGKEKTTESKAKDLDELKKNHPDAARLYEQYGRNQNNGIQVIGGFGGAIQIQGNIQLQPVPGNPIPIQAIPIQAIPIQIGPALPAIPEVPVPDAPAEAEKP